MPAADEKVLRTVADELLELVRKSSRISVEDAAKRLKMPVSSTQALVDFLVEEKIFGIEYKFTTPYIYLYKEGIKTANAKESGFAKGLVTKERFYERSKQRKIPHEHIEGMWRKYLQQNLPGIRGEFLRKARQKKVPEEKIDGLWQKYLSYL